MDTVSLVADATVPGLHVAQPRPAGDDDDEHALQPPAQRVRRRGLQDRRAEDGADHVGGAGDRQEQHAEPEHAA